MKEEDLPLTVGKRKLDRKSESAPGGPPTQIFHISRALRVSMRERGAMSGAVRASAPRMPEGGAASLRSSLFGSSLGAAGAAQRGAGGSSAMAAALEEDNDRLTADLEAKVSALKFATQAIHDEVSEHNRMLSGMVRNWLIARLVLTTMI